jgi:hypothetical protein
MQVVSSFHLYSRWVDSILIYLWRKNYNMNPFGQPNMPAWVVSWIFCRVMNYTQGVSVILIAHIPTQATCVVKMCMYPQYNQTNKKIMWKWKIYANPPCYNKKSN